jgi:dTDP-4-dehydrorhamnose 3,5-epimerase
VATDIAGAFVVEPEPHHDDRGFFARTYDAVLFEEHGLSTAVCQTSISWNRLRGTLRGMHLQVEPAAEAKLVRCTRGAVHDVIVDLRPDSPSFLRHVAVRLDDASRHALYIPPLCAHGFQTLTDDTEVSYQIDAPFEPTAARGYPFDDPAFDIDWPLPVTVISDKDRSWAAYAPPGAGPAS